MVAKSCLTCKYYTSFRELNNNDWKYPDDLGYCNNKNSRFYKNNLEVVGFGQVCSAYKVSFRKYIKEVVYLIKNR